MTRPQTQTEPSERCSRVEPVYVEGAELSMEEWTRMARLMKKAARRAPDVHVGNILKDIHTRDAQLWALVDETDLVVGCIVTQIVEFKTGYVLFEIVLAATEGTFLEHEGIRDVVAKLESVAKSMDCDAIRIVGRKGWGRILGDFKEVNRVYDKVLREANA